MMNVNVGVLGEAGVLEVKIKIFLIKMMFWGPLPPQ